jgi:hypothetical protein
MTSSTSTALIFRSPSRALPLVLDVLRLFFLFSQDNAGSSEPEPLKEAEAEARTHATRCMRPGRRSCGEAVDGRRRTETEAERQQLLGRRWLGFEAAPLCLLVLNQLPSDGDRTDENQLLPSAVFSPTLQDLSFRRKFHPSRPNEMSRCMRCKKKKSNVRNLTTLKRKEQIGNDVGNLLAPSTTNG